MKDLNQLSRELAAGGISCASVSAALNFSDVVKVRMQADSARGGTLLYDSFLHGAQRIAREEGVLALWKHGLAASVLREMSYSSLRMGLYPTVKALVTPNHADGSTQEAGLASKILAAALTGAIGSAVANPTDLVKIKQQAEAGAVCPRTGLLTTGLQAGKAPQYPSVWGAFASIYKQGGVRALYQGVSATTVRAALLTCGQLASYDHSKTVLRRNGWMKEGTALHFTASFVAGLAATTLAAPADLVKSRVMADRKGGKGGLYSGPIDCLVKTVRHEGALALFRGWTASYVRLGPHFLVSLPLLEAIRAAFGLQHM